MFVKNESSIPAPRAASVVILAASASSDPLNPLNAATNSAMETVVIDRIGATNAATTYIEGFSK